jgi:hypothetical protein
VRLDGESWDETWHVNGLHLVGARTACCVTPWCAKSTSDVVLWLNRNGKVIASAAATMLPGALVPAPKPPLVAPSRFARAPVGS